jgi:hypothetical protein
MTVAVNSSQKKTRKTLVERRILGILPEKRAREFLLDVTNLRDTDLIESSNLPRNFLRQYSDILDFLPDAPEQDLNELEKRRLDVKAVRDYFRLAWRAENPRERFWWLSLARILRTERVAIKKMEPEDRLSSGGRFFAIKQEQARVPDETLFEAAVHHLSIIHQHTKCCKNPECPAPYFIAKKNQTYCTPECAAYGQRVAKRNWWSSNRAGQETAGKKQKARRRTV